MSNNRMEDKAMEEMNKLFEYYLKEVKETLNVGELPMIEEISVVWSGKQVADKCEMLTRKMVNAHIDGKNAGLEKCKEIISGTSGKNVEVEYNVKS